MTRKSIPAKHIHPVAMFVTLALLNASLAEAAITIPTIPLQAINSAEPNIMMILDDSGSMQWDYMPEDINGVTNPINYIYPTTTQIYGGSIYANYTVDTDAANRWTRMLRSSSINKLYYDPAITYTPWSNYDGTLWAPANPLQAYHNPAIQGAGFRNLTVNLTENATWMNDNGSYTTQNRTYYPATYFQYNGGSITAAGSYTTVKIISTTATYPPTTPKATTRTDCTTLATKCTYAEEIQNFANWYSYHRSRVLTARGGIGRAFANQGTNIRVGFAAINKGSTTIDGVSARTVVSGVRKFTGAARTQFFTDLYGRTIPQQGTPLRQALDDVGQYYSRADALGPWSNTPGVAGGGTELTCRQSYAIMMTDGYWNGSAASTGAARTNNDNTGATVEAPPPLTTPPTTVTSYTPANPFRDAWSNTLADVAMYYWKNDLRTNLANEVPLNSSDPAFWQHMVTFGVGLGVSGTVSPTTAFANISTGIGVNWPDPNTGSNSALADDLLHASVNGRGGYFSAQNPQQFANALTATLNNISQRSGSASSIAANSTQISTNTKIFNAKFDTGKWSGELEAIPITSTGVATSPVWSASSLIPAASSRNILTRSGSSAVAFQWANLSASDKTAMVSSDVVDYIRGTRTKEQQNGGSLRNRQSVLGDIVDSTPAYVLDSDSIYVGANDGMLHGFNANTGVELFAYIPSAVIPTLANLSSPAYSHAYYVDGDIAVSSKAQTSNRNYLVSLLGRGGKGLFALDITNPTTFSTTDVLWEYFNSADNDLGYMLGTPIIAKMNNGSMVAIVGNGYNSANGNAVMYVFDLATGGVIKKFDTLVSSDNGMGTPGVLDADSDGDIDYIYGGDLKGNVWKIDVSSANPAAWDFSFKSGSTPQALFVAKDSSGSVQPITTSPTPVMDNVAGDVNFGKLFLFFGTGSYFRSTDSADTQVQTMYGLIDTNTPVSGRSQLTQRSVLANGVFNVVVNGNVVDTKNVRTFSAAVAGDMIGKSGWYLDLKTATGVAEGERVTTSAEVYVLAEPTLIFSSIIPINDPCKPGGKGYLSALSPFTGGRLTVGFYDIDNNNSFANDQLNGINIGSVDLGIGGLSKGKVIGNWLVAGGMTGKTGGAKINTGAKKTKRISWREIIRD
ncbi:MAG TPA: PilC/PilY family type IV pilus protein [Azonexus sp.]|nr:PilC/PilY family type IV pilus protein [Azonexus sp.]